MLPTECGKSLIFQLAPKVCSYLHDRGFRYPKAATVVVICPLNALIGSHIPELKENPKTVNTSNIVFRVKSQSRATKLNRNHQR